MQREPVKILGNYREPAAKKMVKRDVGLKVIPATEHANLERGGTVALKGGIYARFQGKDAQRRLYFLAFNPRGVKTLSNLSLT